MTDEEYQFILQDRIAKIQAINEQWDLLNNSYVSDSGGKDSRVNSRLLDIALPNNKIPRVYFNTGIEYKTMLDFMKEKVKNDSRVIIVNSGVNIKKMLEENGYPFKSKQHSHNWAVYNNNNNINLNETIKYLENNQDKQYDYDYIHNLPKGTKTIIKYIFGIREKDMPNNVVERERESIITSSMSILTCPESLRYQFTTEFKNKGLKFSDKCCYKLKKEIALKYEEASNRNIAITGIRGQEGGMRALNGCTIFSDGKLKKFHPLKTITDEWEEEFIKRENIELCKLYKPPFNFDRTGCVACPYALNIQEELNRLYQYLPSEYYKAIKIWKPVYDEYIRIGYRLKYYPHERGIQLSIDDYLKEVEK